MKDMEQKEPMENLSPQEASQPVPEHTPKEEPACPSIFDKPDDSRFKTKAKKKRKQGSRQVRNVIVASVLCVAILLSASGICRLLYGKGLIGFGKDFFTDIASDTSSVDQESQQVVHDYSQYRESPADSDTLALGGIASIRVENQEDAYTLKSYMTARTEIDQQTYEEVTRDVLEWVIEAVDGKDVQGVHFNPSSVGYIVSDVLKIPYESVYVKDGSATIPQGGKTYFDECGFSKSKERVAITFADGSAVTVVLGDETPTGKGRFLRVENKAGSSQSVGAPKEDLAIYQVDESAVVYFLKAADYYVSKDMIDPVQQADSTYDDLGNETEDPYFISGALSYFDALSISGLSYNKDFVFKIVQEDQPGYDSIYLMTSPYTQNVDLTAMETLLAPMADGLSAANCLVMKATPAQIAQYGLDQPACQVRYVIKEKETVLKVGKQVSRENNTYAVMVQGNPTVFEVRAEDIPFITYDEADFASDTLYSCDITKVRSIRVQMENGFDQWFVLTHGTNAQGDATLSVKTQKGQSVEEEAFRNMYVDFLSLTSFTNVTDGKDAARPYMTITLDYNDFDQTDVIRLSPYTDRRYFMSLNGMGSTVVLSSAVENLTKSVTDLVK